MGEDNLEKAKEMFRIYLGDKWAMDHDDYELYEKYKSFGISEAQEREWSEAAQKKLLKIVVQEDIVSDSFMELKMDPIVMTG